MATGAIRVYADTSVFGGCFDEEFQAASVAFFEQVRFGRFVLVSSAAVREEIAPAPENVRAFFAEMLPFIETVETTPEARRLHEAYLRAGIVGEAGNVDALHVAVATVSGCRAIVSWNFKHIVHFNKIPLYSGINLVEGYGTLGIHAPWEVIADETES